MCYTFHIAVPRATRFDKVVRREVCSIITKGRMIVFVLTTSCYCGGFPSVGTCTMGYQDRGGVEPESLFLTAIKEDGVAYGVCFIDTSIGTFHVSTCICRVQSTL